MRSFSDAHFVFKWDFCGGVLFAFRVWTEKCAKGAFVYNNIFIYFQLSKGNIFAVEASHPPPFLNHRNQPLLYPFTWRGNFFIYYTFQRNREISNAYELCEGICNFVRKLQRIFNELLHRLNFFIIFTILNMKNKFISIIPQQTPLTINLTNTSQTTNPVITLSHPPRATFKCRAGLRNAHIIHTLYNVYNVIVHVCCKVHPVGH